MQNKGFVTAISVCLALICAFYLSFSFVTNHYDKKAEAMGAELGAAYLDSMENEHVWAGHTLKQARVQQIGLGLDLKGGMNVILKLNAGDLLRSLAGHPEDALFNQAIDEASKSTSQSNYVDEFIAQYKKLAPEANLAVVFGSHDLRDRITTKTTEAEVIELLKEKYESAIGTSFNVLRARIDRFGVVAPNLQRLEGQGRILVELPGVKEPERVRELLQRSANLQFWRTYTWDEVGQDLMAANARLSELSQSQTEQIALPDTVGLDSLQIAAAMAEYEAKRAAQAPTQGNALFSMLQPGAFGGAVVGMARKNDIEKIDELLAEAKRLRLLREDLSLMWGAQPIQDPETGRATDTYQLFAIRTNRSMSPDLSGEVVTKASSEIHNEFGRVSSGVSMTMNSEGSQKWARLTRDNVGRSIAVVLDGVVYSAPNVNGEITGGVSSITGNFSVEEAGDLANVLNSGKMDASIVIEQENVVGPTLGAESIRAGVISFAIALALLMIYMCLAYGFKPGMVANVALLINSFFTLGILASFGAVLTLSGIAGLVLTLGMAVDANVLINERIREELAKGKDMTKAIADGYGNAFSAIFDSNLTTIITGVVLFYFGTGPIRGFATTLIIGLVASFLTSVFITRIILEALDKKGALRNETYDTSLTRNFLRNTSFDFIAKRQLGTTVVGAIVVAGLIGIFTLGFNRGIEFSGGRNYIIKFDQKVNNDAVRSALAPEFDNKLVLTSIGTDGDQVRISTNYKIQDESAEVEQEITTKLYNGLKGFYSTAPQSVDSFEAEGIISSQKVSPSMSADITRGAVIAVVLALVFMALYILLRFRNMAFSLGALASVSATTFIILAFYALLWQVMPFSMEIDQSFIAALLAIIGYSINDVVIVFDRIREEMKNAPKASLKDTFNLAMNTTLSRTFNTSFTTLLTMLIVFSFGGASMRGFTFAILLGIVFGTFCTLFVATPVAHYVATRRAK